MNSTKQINDYILNNELDLDRIVEDFTSYIQTIIYNMVGNNLSNEDKEEILSDTFFILWKNKDKNILSLDAYIAGITRNLIREKLRKRMISFDILNYENTISYIDVNMYSDKRYEIEEIRECVNTLSDVEYKILTMFYYSSKSTKDIAKELKLSEINVRTKLHRIRKK